MFRRILKCPISFFDTNPMGTFSSAVASTDALECLFFLKGRILNRFTKDLGTMDDILPWTLISLLQVKAALPHLSNDDDAKVTTSIYFQCVFQILGVLGLVAWLNPWSLLPAGVAAIAMLFLRSRFAQCSRDLKRLENTSRSPIYSYVTSTINGLKVIRSYHAEHICSSEFFSHLDDNTKAYYLFLTTNRWAAIRFDWIALTFIVIVTVLALVVRIAGRQFSPADIALTLSYSLSLLSLFQWTVR